MKTQVMKKKMKTRLALAVLMLALGSSAYAQTVNPFQEGVKLTALTTAQVESLQEYLDASKTALTKALDQAKGKSFGEANQIYLDVIKAVVIESYKNTPRSGLILRFALNQALELTFGVPSLDGKTSVSSGVLQSTNNQDLLTVMLEDSIQLALKYYQDDHDAVPFLLLSHGCR